MNKSENFNASLKNVGFMLNNQNSEPASCSFLSLFQALRLWGRRERKRRAKSLRNLANKTDLQLSVHFFFLFK